MTWKRLDVKNNAKKMLKRKYWISFFVSLITAIFSTKIIIIFSDPQMTSLLKYNIILFSIIGILIHIFISNPLEVGKKAYYLKEEQEVGEFKDLFSVFRMKGYLNIVKVMLIRDIKIALWTLLFIVPAFVKLLEYRMIPYILAQDSNVSSKEAFERSKILMEGDKWNVFVLDLSFLGWILLGLLLFGIGIYFVYPYVDATEVFLYKTLEIKAT